MQIAPELWTPPGPLLGIEKLDPALGVEGGKMALERRESRFQIAFKSLSNRVQIALEWG